MRTAMGFWASKTLMSAVELGIFDALASSPLDATALWLRLGIHERGARDFFDALVALGLLQRDNAGLYTNSPETARIRTGEGYRSPCPGDDVGEVGDLCLAEWAHDFEHNRLVTNARVAFVFAQRSYKIVLALRRDARNIVAPSEIGLMADVAVMLLQERRTALDAYRISFALGWLWRWQLADEIRELSQVVVGEVLSLLVH
jgi:hypothetical protein